MTQPGVGFGGSFHSGIGAPSGSVGVDGDFYMDLNVTNTYYGPKSGGSWGSAKAFVVPLTNNTAVVAPTISNDASQGYAIGSTWVNTSTNVQYVCTSATAGSAVWTPILPVGTVSGTVAAGNDSRIAGAIQAGSTAGGDLTGNWPNPQVSTTHLASALPVAQGGTGSATQNFVDLSTSQNIGGVKNFTGSVTVPSPVGPNDVATKTYADSISAGLSVKGSSVVATTGALPTNTYNNGTAGVGATLTATATGTLTVDGHLVALNDRVVVKNEATAANNGIYLCTTAGAVGVAYVLTRATDMNTASAIPGAYSFVTSGSTLASSGWIVSAPGPYTIGTTAINWTQFSSAATINVGTGLSQAGNTISLITPVAPSNLPPATNAAEGVVQLTGDLSGTANAPTVAKLQGIAISGTPAFGQVLIGQTGTTAAWQLNPYLYGSTGVGTGGVMTFHAGQPTQFDISAGTGFIVDNVSSPSSPTVTKVTIAGQTIDLTTFGSSVLTRSTNWWMVNSSGTVVVQGTTPTNVQRRQFVILGVTGSVPGTGVLFNVQPVQDVLPQPEQQLYDLLYGLGPFNQTGNNITANAATLTIGKAVGTMFDASFNSGNNQNDPHTVTCPVETTAQFKNATRVSGSESALTSTLDVTHYDAAGTLTLVPGGGPTSTIQRVFLFGTGVATQQLAIQYGQAFYASLSAATAAVGVEAFTVNPDFTGIGTLIAWICVTKSATDLSNTSQCAIIPAGKFVNP